MTSDAFAQLAPDQVIGKVTYLQLFSFPDAEPVEKNYDLFLGADQGLYIEQSVSDASALRADKPNITETADGINLSYSYKVDHRWPIHTNLRTKQLVQETVLFHRGKITEFIVTEQQVPIRWKLTTEEKLIGQILCRKATGYFRGRDYEAWYAPEIPVRLGPWKFSGLPGLILEVYDTKKHVFFSTTGISLPATVAALPETWLGSQKPVQQIDLKESVKINREQKEEVFQSILAKLPRGAVVELDDKEANTIETRYEFDF